jgi:hypothetical protein
MLGLFDEVDDVINDWSLLEECRKQAPPANTQHCGFVIINGVECPKQCSLGADHRGIYLSVSGSSAVLVPWQHVSELGNTEWGSSFCTQLRLSHLTVGISASTYRQVVLPFYEEQAAPLPNLLTSFRGGVKERMM